MAFFGCDMVYAATGKTHFYGTGTADPLRPDVTLQSLEGKAARLQLLAAEQGCACVNLFVAGQPAGLFRGPRWTIWPRPRRWWRMPRRWPLRGRART